MTPNVIAGLVLACTPAATAPAPSLRDPYQIFARARAYWLEQRYPALLEYDVAVTVLEGGVWRTQRYWSAYDASSGAVAVDEVSDYERENPTDPAGGFNFVVHGPNGIIPSLSSLVKPQPPTDFLGVPFLAPNYSFGMAQKPAATSATPDPSTLPVIERETVYGPVYRVTLVGVESIYGVPAYHLRLEALREPGRYRLQQLWVDARTLAPIQLVERENFVEGPGTTVPWRVRFENVAGALYVYDEVALRPIRYDGLLYLQASIAFENVRAVQTLSRPPPPLEPQVPLILEEPALP